MANTQLYLYKLLDFNKQLKKIKKQGLVITVMEKLPKDLRPNLKNLNRVAEPPIGNNRFNWAPARILKHLLKFPDKPTMFEPRLFEFGPRFNKEQVVVEPRSAGSTSSFLSLVSGQDKRKWFKHFCFLLNLVSVKIELFEFWVWHKNT